MPEKVVFSESVKELGSKSGDGYPVVILTPGLGASAYYSESVIASDAPTAFPKGTHVYMTHERGSTGEPSPEKLLGTLVEDTTIREDGAAVNRFVPLPRWAEFVDQVKPHVGLSIQAHGSASIGNVDGRQVKIAESIDYHISNSVDLVSFPGRSGSGFVESAFAAVELEVQPEPSAPGSEKEREGSMPTVEEKVDALTESVAALTALVESALPKAPSKDEIDHDADRAAAVEAVAIVEAAEVPASVKAKLRESVKAGNYDVKADIDEAIALRESIKTELIESGAFVGAAGAGGGSETPVVKGWGN